MKVKGNRLVSVWLSEQQFEDLRRMAFESKKSKSEFVRDMLFGSFKEV